MQAYNAKDLKVGSIIEMIEFCPILKKQITVRQPINRVSEKYVWFKYSGYLRIGRETINKYPTLYKIVQI